MDEMRRLKQFEEKIWKLKQLVDDTGLNTLMAQDAFSKNPKAW
jgi:hypothetical protein